MQQHFHATMRAVVERYFPSELAAFTLEGESLVMDLFEGKDIRAGDSCRKGEFGFAAEAIAAIDFVKVMWSAFEAVKETRTAAVAMTDSQIATLQALWQKRLKESGIPDPPAGPLVDEFSRHLLLVLDR